MPIDKPRYYDMESNSIKRKMASQEETEARAKRLELEFSDVLTDFLTSIATNPRFEDLTPLEILDTITSYLQKNELRTEAVMTIEAQRIDKM